MISGLQLVRSSKKNPVSSTKLSIQEPIPLLLAVHDTYVVAIIAHFECQSMCGKVLADTRKNCYRQHQREGQGWLFCVVGLEIYPQRRITPQCPPSELT